MEFDITEIPKLSGAKAHIYSVTIRGETDTLLEQFFNENRDHADELATILNKILIMADDTGCRRQYFTEGEGKLADGVVALKSGRLRLYGMYFNNTVVLFGSGGWKTTRTYQEDELLNRKAEQIKEIAAKINKAILERTIIIGDDGIIDDENWENYE